MSKIFLFSVLLYPLFATAQSDPTTVGEFRTANVGEIVVARSVVDRLQTPSVRDFANKMIVEHTAAIAKLDSLGLSRADTDLSRQLIEHFTHEIEALSCLSGIGLDRMYIAAQVDDHQAVLTLLDQRWIPNAQNPDLKQLLCDARVSVVEHLLLAKQILNQLDQGQTSKLPGLASR